MYQKKKSSNLWEVKEKCANPKKYQIADNFKEDITSE